MSKKIIVPFIQVLLLCQSFSSQARLHPRFEDGLAITHPRVLMTLQQRASGMGIGLGYYLDPTDQSPPKISNRELSKLPAFQPILEAISDEVEYFKKTTESKYNTVGVGTQFHSRLFDQRFLRHDRSLFSLIGVVHRIDKLLESPETCGETRLIFRLAYNVLQKANDGTEHPVSSRLPMTLNLILNAKSADSPMTCREITKRWAQLNIEGLDISKAVDQIFADSGPLSPDLRNRSLLKGLELNLQLARKAAAVRPDFGGHAVYLLKAFDWDSTSQKFKPKKLRNQVAKSKADDFYRWFFSRDGFDQRLKDLDGGTLEIPEAFLDTRAYSVAPGGLSRKYNHPLGDTLSDEDIQKYISQADYDNLTYIKSIEGFKRRLTDSSCTGCHQSRAIGGFHFMGQDPSMWNEVLHQFDSRYLGNSVVVPGSGHFFSDLVRRQSIQNEIIDGIPPDFSSGFSSRPSESYQQFEGSEDILTGWGAHCNVGDDPSFKHWNCDSGLKCAVIYKSRMAKDFGICISQNNDQLGDPTENGTIKTPTKNSDDRYEADERIKNPNSNRYVLSPQSASSKNSTGGFPAGSIRTKNCDTSVMSDHPEGLCGALPAARGGFNSCVFDPNKTFEQCVIEFSTGVGLRACSRTQPCRDDYICSESLYEVGQVPNEELIRLKENAGVCVPPYFLFQFRVDGHPVKF